MSQEKTKITWYLFQLFIILSISLNSSFALETSSSTIVVEEEILFELSFDPTQEQNLEYFTIIKDGNFNNYKEKQQVLSSNSNLKENQITKNNTSTTFSFTLEDLKEKNSLKNTYVLNSKPQENHITKKISFPQKNNNPNSEFLSYGELINKNEEIEELANSLASGQEDTFQVAIDIANWVQENINYDLDTVFENPKQTSTQTLTLKQGVCKEISNLYISLLRTVGIEARVVEGFAQTNSQELIDYLNSTWGGHAWVEVKLGETWIPIDITYNQFGYIDENHIITYKGAFNSEKSFSLDAKSSGISLVPNSFSTSTKIQTLNTTSSNREDEYSISTNILQSTLNLSPGSYGWVKVELENKKPHYQVIQLQFLSPQEMEILTQKSQILLLKPSQKKELLFTFKMPELEGYLFPIKIISNQINDLSLNISLQQNQEQFNLDELPQIKTPQKFNKGRIEFSCEKYLNENLQPLATCIISNTQNYPQEITFCSNVNCNSTNLNIGQIINKKIPLAQDTTTIYLTYNNTKKEINFTNNIPTLNLVSQSKNNTITVNSSIEHFLEGTKILLKQEETILRQITSQKSSIPINFNPKAYTKITFELQYKNSTLQTKTLELGTKPQEIQIQKEEESFLEKIWEFIIGLF